MFTGQRATSLAVAYAGPYVGFWVFVLVRGEQPISDGIPCLGRQRDDMAVPGLFLPYGEFLNNIAVVIRDVENSERQEI